jgi:hypothetical protein
MSENLIDSVAPQLSAPVTRQPGGTTSSSSEGVDQSVISVLSITIAFAADDDE